MTRRTHSGTIVDDVVTLNERYNFCLVSQSVRQVRSFRVQLEEMMENGMSGPPV